MWAKHVGEKNWLPCPFWLHWTSQDCNWHLEPHNLIKIQGLSQHSPPSINTPPIHPDTTLPTHYRYYCNQMSTDSWLMIDRYVGQYSTNTPPTPIYNQYSTDARSTYLTIIIPLAQMGSESIAAEWAIDSEATRVRGIIVLVKSN